MGKRHKERGRTFNGDGLETAWGYTRSEIERAMRDRESVSQLNVALDAEMAKGRTLIMDLLKVLHKTGVSKKEVADRGRAFLGLEPGAKLP